MSISPRLMKRLANDGCSFQERFYYQTRCLYNRDTAYREKHKEDVVMYQYQADRIQAIIDPENAEKVSRPPQWLLDWAPEECGKFYGKLEAVSQ